MIPKEIKLALKKLIDSHNEAYIVGGAVRNRLLNKEINDYDITTSASPNTIKLLFGEYNQYTIGEKHGTVVVLIGDYKIDITTFRKDVNYIDHRHPQSVEYTTDLNEDLKRRDFTINALCLDINENIIDLFNGLEDLNSKTIKAIGNPNTRFKEDALRILRAIKFASRLNFEIECETEKALFINKDLLKVIANERKKDEFLQILSTKDKVRYINRYLDIFKTFINIEQVDDTINNFLDPYFSLAYLIKDKKDIDLKKLTFSKYEINLINALIESSFIDINDDFNLISCLSNMYEVEILNYLSQLHKTDLSSKYQKLKPYIVDINSLEIKGNEIMKYGFVGKDIKTIKDKLVKEIRLQHLSNNHDEIMKYLDKSYNY